MRRLLVLLLLAFAAVQTVEPAIVAAFAEPCEDAGSDRCMDECQSCVCCTRAFLSPAIASNRQPFRPAEYRPIIGKAHSFEVPEEILHVPKPFA